MSILGVVWAERAGGGGRTPRRYLDFVIDGTPLSAQVRADVISPLGWSTAPSQAAVLDRLRGRGEPDLPLGRISLYVCPECGELGCGTVSMRLERGRGAVVWREFGFQNNYESAIRVEPYAELGPFRFEGRAYHRLLESLQRELAATGV